MFDDDRFFNEEFITAHEMGKRWVTSQDSLLTVESELVSEIHIETEVTDDSEQVWVLYLHITSMDNVTDRLFMGEYINKDNAVYDKKRFLTWLAEEWDGCQVEFHFIP